ncbi:unnamed protein product [Mytilus edulis]|uniref:Uncharacterized protein n=1 Tax=Mytilus edulis TaxID=6550 RepID=A0A8S3QI28_MYTED|nr:unnamed protein product [Mytilus edulis]
MAVSQTYRKDFLQYLQKQGDRCHVANYRGITVLPVVNKIIEAIIRDEMQPRVLKDQNPTQRVSQQNHRTERRKCQESRRSTQAFGSGFNGENGLDPESLIHLYKTYISPVLLCRMDASDTKISTLGNPREVPEKDAQTNSLSPYVLLISSVHSNQHPTSRGQIHTK